ncbi:FAD-dependent oxidoreductase [Nonomuraea sp. NPDC050556]|uniref:FAD-dependent oxidoreductase n=1 Tax=Nonomuraea sp. NPDC050556 TaxID=3364369 RepID=UPI0037938869
MALPSRSEIVIIGGGVIGCSIAFHLAERGKTDVVVIERLGLTHGTTWHAAGLVGQLRSSSNLTRLMKHSAELYAGFGEEAGWRGVGSIRVASSEQRWQELRRAATTGKSFGFDVHLITPREAQELYPLLDLSGIVGATWIPSDGYTDPSQLTHTFAAAARARGVRIVQHCRVEGMERVGRRVTAVRTEQGRIEANVVVNATGMWGDETARMAGASVAVCALEHQYLVTEKSDQIPWDLPTFRDPDGRFYIKPEASALAVGGWESGTASFGRGGIDRDFGPRLLPGNYERFEPLGEAATARVPFLGEVGIREMVNGPIPFTPDAEPLMGTTGDLDNLFHCCGFSSGIAAAGGAGLAMANWIIDGDPGMDLWPFDVRRFGQPHLVRSALYERAVEAYSRYYAIAYPQHEQGVVRGQRRSPLYDRLAGRGAVYGAKFGYERPLWYGGPGEEPSFGRTAAWDRVAAEHRAVREGVGLIDMSSFSTYEINGPGALPLLQRLAGAEMDVAVGKIVYTQLLNRRGGIEADVTITRLAEERFYLVTGSAFGPHDTAFLLAHSTPDVAITDVSSATAVINVCGPRSRDVLSHLTHDDLAFPYMTGRELDLGYAPVLALRATYVGELGWELHVPTEYARDLYDRLLGAGSAFGIRDVGYRAVQTLRMEKQYLAWAADITSDNNPFEAGLDFCTRPDKPELLAGPALREIRDRGVSQRLCWFTTGAEPVMHGGELVAYEGRALSSVKSAGFGHTVGATVFSAYVPVELAGEREFEVEIMGERFSAVRHDGPRYDPKGIRIRA